MDDGGRVVEVGVAVDEADDQRVEAAQCRGRELVERATVVADEGRLQEQILGRVAGDRQLGEGDDVGAILLGFLDQSRTMRALPSRSPTVVLIWASATRSDLITNPPQT